MSNYLWLNGLQHARLLCPPLSPRVCSNSCPLSQGCYLTISSFVVPFSFCLQSSPVSGSFPMSWFFISGGQSIGASASVLPMSIQDQFPLGLSDLISLQSNGLSRVFSSTTRSSAFSKTSLNIWKFMVHVLLKPALENFKHHLLACEMSAVVW